ncbi:hypothetical protein CgunFtcFv8_002634 [Champsocephalus gunnari]|uniref:Uncharacterized protein n=1 Tax=Champsocephalus gunnari TaxID=52237 RepID=A0AAN8D9A2_CHAGU|nr:hypothetical protein CgunFtcFv8_002634 [Champsocephalus gunnari]
MLEKIPSLQCGDAKQLNEMHSADESDEDDDIEVIYLQKQTHYMDTGSISDSSSSESAVKPHTTLHADSNRFGNIQKSPEESNAKTDTQEQHEEFNGSLCDDTYSSEVSFPAQTGSDDTLRSITYYKCCVALLLVRLLTIITKATKTRLTLTDFSEIIENLASRMTREHYDTETFLNHNSLALDDISKCIFKDLKKVFGSAKLMQVAMFSYDLEFDDAVIRCLTHYLIVHEVLPKEKGVVLRFFTSLSTAVAKPFKSCCGKKVNPGSHDQEEDDFTLVEDIYIAPEQQITEDYPFSADLADTSKYQKVYQHLIYLVFVGLLTHTAKEARESIRDIDLDRILRFLTARALTDKALNIDIFSCDNKKFKKISKDLFRDLRQQFGSAEALLEAIISQEPDVADAIIETLKTNLVSPTQKKNTIVRVFSNMAKSFHEALLFQLWMWI